MQHPSSGAGAVRADATPTLSERDLETLRHLAAGRSTGQIAAAMSISTNTVRGRVRRLLGKLAVSDRDRVVDAARALGAF
ncbi:MULTISPECIES: response regulator transcription factor [unclassified Geodermatophilus]